MEFTCEACIPRRRHRLRLRFARHAYILTSDTRDFLKLFLWQAERHADIVATILARMSARMSVSVSVSWNAGFTDRVSRKGRAISSVCLSVRLFPLYVLSQLTFELEFCMRSGYDPSSPGIESQGHGSRSKFRVESTSTSVKPRYIHCLY